MPNPVNTFRSEHIDPMQYSLSVQELINMARKDCSGSRVCAQVLLSAYNGDAFQLDITDLCMLDDHYYGHALTVIRGRVELRIEPHEMICGGGKIFEKLWDQWRGYHISRRGNNAEAA